MTSENGVPVIPRGAGTSLAGGAIPQEDAVVVGISKMNRILDVDFGNRTARVQAGVTNLAISQAVAHAGFYYAPDPSSQDSSRRALRASPTAEPSGRSSLRHHSRPHSRPHSGSQQGL